MKIEEQLGDAKFLAWAAEDTLAKFLQEDSASREILQTEAWCFVRPLDGQTKTDHFDLSSFVYLCHLLSNFAIWKYQYDPIIYKFIIVY